MKNLFAILLTLICYNASASELQISQGYVRATPPGQMISSAFMHLTNTSTQTLILTGARSVSANNIEIHNHAMVDGIMSMQHMQELAIAPGQTLVLAPGSLNFMLMGVKQPLIPGQQIPFAIVFKNGTEQILNLPIKSIVNHSSTAL